MLRATWRIIRDAMLYSCATWLEKLQSETIQYEGWWAIALLTWIYGTHFRSSSVISVHIAQNLLGPEFRVAPRPCHGQGGEARPASGDYCHVDEDRCRNFSSGDGGSHSPLWLLSASGGNFQEDVPK